MMTEKFKEASMSDRNLQVLHLLTTVMDLQSTGKRSTMRLLGLVSKKRTTNGLIMDYSKMITYTV